jgi:hypothetical protein
MDLSACLQNPHQVSGTVSGLGWRALPVHCNPPRSGLVGVIRGCHREHLIRRDLQPSPLSAYTPMTCGMLLNDAL